MKSIGFETNLCKALQTSLSLHQKQGRAPGTICEREFSRWLGILPSYRPELAGTCMVQPAKWYLPPDGGRVATADPRNNMLKTTACLPETESVRLYLYPKHQMSFYGFVNYEGRRFGVPYSYPSAAAIHRTSIPLI